jgi:hypothetical protein
VWIWLNQDNIKERTLQSLTNFPQITPIDHFQSERKSKVQTNLKELYNIAKEVKIRQRPNYPHFNWEVINLEAILKKLTNLMILNFLEYVLLNKIIFR